LNRGVKRLVEAEPSVGEVHAAGGLVLSQDLPQDPGRKTADEILAVDDDALVPRVVHSTPISSSRTRSGMPSWVSGSDRPGSGMRCSSGRNPFSCGQEGGDRVGRSMCFSMPTTRASWCPAPRSAVRSSTACGRVAPRRRCHRRAVDRIEPAAGLPPDVFRGEVPGGPRCAWCRSPNCWWPTTDASADVPAHFAHLRRRPR
jgi:hypothetical protein